MTGDYTATLNADRCLLCGHEFNNLTVVVIHEPQRDYPRVALCDDCINILHGEVQSIYQGIVSGSLSLTDKPFIKRIS